MKVQTAAAILIIAYLSSSRADDRARVYCGRVLAEQMALLCSYGEDKRSGSAMYGGAPRAGWLGPRVYRAYGGGRGKRGIIEDCCLQPCDIPTLLSYC